MSDDLEYELMDEPDPIQDQFHCLNGAGASMNENFQDLKLGDLLAELYKGDCSYEEIHTYFVEQIGLNHDQEFLHCTIKEQAEQYSEMAKQEIVNDITQYNRKFYINRNVNYYNTQYYILQQRAMKITEKIQDKHKLLQEISDQVAKVVKLYYNIHIHRSKIDFNSRDLHDKIFQKTLYDDDTVKQFSEGIANSSFAQFQYPSPKKKKTPKQQPQEYAKPQPEKVEKTKSAKKKIPNKQPPDEIKLFEIRIFDYVDEANKLIPNIPEEWIKKYIITNKKKRP